MNERQSNAMIRARLSAYALADRLSLPRPDLHYVNADNERETTVLLERLQAFLGVLEGVVAQDMPTTPAGAQSGSDVVSALRNATVEELTRVPHIGKATAKKIKAAFDGGDV